jgi:hypothetical protein
MKTKPYTKHKKNTKKPDLAEGQWTPGEYKDETQLDRIERKLDELLSRPVITPPGQWAVPRTYTCYPTSPVDPMPTGPVDPSWPITRTDRPQRWPVGYWGEPIPYA